MNISEFYTLEELTKTDRAEFKAKNLQSAMDSPAVIKNLKALCNEILDPIARKFGKAIIHSAYRCAELNKAVGGSDTSFHKYGLAADFHVPGHTLEEVHSWVDTDLAFEENYLESRKSTGSRWLHGSRGTRKKTRVINL